MWDRYTELYPDADLVYTIGVSDYTKDWFFAQVPRSDSWNIDYLYNVAEDYIAYFIYNNCMSFELHITYSVLIFQACITAEKERITLIKEQLGKSSLKSVV